MDRLSAHQEFEAVLKQAGYSVTNVRKTVFDALLGREPQFMNQIIDEVGSAVDRASVYRTIELFEKIGIVQRLMIGWKYKLELSDLFTHHHHHLSCENCGRTFVINESPAAEQLIKDLAKQAGFLPQRHQLEIHGLCKDCQKQAVSS